MHTSTGANRSMVSPLDCLATSAMQAAYLSGDPYLEFAKQAGAVPADATKSSHTSERELFKQCTLAVGTAWKPKVWRSVSASPRSSPATCYVRTAKPIASSGHGPTRPSIAPCYCTRCRPFSAGQSGLAVIRTRARLRNFPCQANGAEMLRLAACFATEQGLEVCALIHDAVLIAAPLDQLDNDIERMQAAMAKASRVVLDGFELRTDVNVVRYPDRYQDPRGTAMWNRVMGLMAEARSGKTRGRMMNDQDDIGIEKLRVDPALMQQVLEQQARKSKRKGWQRIYTDVAEGVGTAPAGRKTDQHLSPGDRAALPTLVRQGQAHHRLQQGGTGR